MKKEHSEQLRSREILEKYEVNYSDFTTPFGVQVLAGLYNTRTGKTG